ncbi:MAG: molybdenum ABC transporter ATP-binding protein [Burkholderiales bacterium RIFCSPLOWO2_12_67_14]|nr:MAG: molybdenum ABC transporter ATP-binding protein [Burkholderiales bacterium RIFCSPLOWO2_02_FULL_67_64]OGB38714.1 MAG: molybdenum ABC transporter ATP-binding protein [Burkholderiales bacterium RIFCSPLOWO2_12_67_14]OGB39210.1 MAG: molybdenum ABC transporter ATP-binding protein [Burkholderiales bacterium RIFCSPHIGHO2_12_FULL_67_38]OGB76476.1 MAG: molybdenum ABC transporter ATP-binding protein [Burkholderiales bacterium RIFCSPLOWO2_12_FULL_67_210]
MPGIQTRFQLDWPGFSLDVDLALPARGVTALFGHSGSGKTTLLRCIAGLERAPQGRLVVHGDVWQDSGVWLPTHQRPLGYVFQEASLFPHLTVMGNLRYGLRRLPGAGKRGLDQAIELLGIGHLLDRKPARLSGGERSRIGIARALALGPRLLLMDEPLAALDLARKQEILPYLERLHRELDIPVIYVSHAPDEVARLADHIVAMEAGRALASGPLAEVLSRVDLPIHLGEDAGVVLEGVVVERDAAWSLARVAFPGGCLWVRDGGQTQGATVRIRILARDVSLALSPATDTSLLNSLPVVVDQLADDNHPALALCRLQVGTSSSLLARLTRRSAAALGLAPGQAVWAQIKAVALIG